MTRFTFAVAPMMDWTDRHCRVFHRMLSRRAMLYTEMVVADAVIHGDRNYLLGYDQCEHPLALQIGGSDPAKLAKASRIGADFGYGEINLNVGCPSSRVQAGRFGASLMAEPELVAACFIAMQEASSVPVTVKCRIGIDDQNTHETLPKFIEMVAASGCETFIIHARKAWLDGLSPKDNRTVPPLNYALVHDIKTAFPKLKIHLNGGLEHLSQTEDHADHLDGVMYGRAAYHTPWMLSRVDHLVYGDNEPSLTRDGVAQQLIEYAQSYEQKLPSTKGLIRHIMGLYHGQIGARIWRRTLSEAPPDLLTSQKIYAALTAIQIAREQAE